jgi:hypothetical protein
MNFLWVDWVSLKIALVWRAISSGRYVRMIKQFFRFRSDDGFRGRSPERDASSDNEAVRSIAAEIDAALSKAEAERTGLQGRIDDVISRAAIVGGNDIDEYLTRTEDRSIMLSNSDAEIKRGQERLRVIDQNIVHFKFLRTALQTRFPDLKI